MGEVVSMTDWRNRVPKRLTDREVVVNEIKRLLRESIVANQKVGRLLDYQAREQAVVKGLALLMEAHRYAESHGMKIERVCDEDGTLIQYSIIG